MSMEQSFFFDWDPPGEPTPVPTTAQCETLHVSWSRQAATGYVCPTFKPLARELTLCLCGCQARSHSPLSHPNIHLQLHLPIPDQCWLRIIHQHHHSICSRHPVPNLHVSSEDVHCGSLLAVRKDWRRVANHDSPPTFTFSGSIPSETVEDVKPSTRSIHRQPRHRPHCATILRCQPRPLM